MARQLVDALVAQVRSDPALDLTSPAALAIMTADLPTRAEAVALLAAELKDEMLGGFFGRLGKATPKAPALHRVLASLLEGNLPLTEAQLVALVWASWEGLPMGRLLHHVEHYARLHGLPSEAAEPLKELERQVPQAATALRAVRGWLRNWPAGVVDPDAWGRALGAWMTELDDATQGPWIALLRHCNGASTAVQPSATWSRRAGRLVSEVGPRPFAARLGDFTAELSIADGLGELRWLRPDGRAQVSVPKAVRESHPGELEALKAQVRELNALLVGQATRFERLWLSERRLPLEALRRRSLAHPIVGQLGRRLIWLVQAGGVRHELLWQSGGLALVGAGKPPQLPAKAEARLWHPLDAPSPEAILVWRDLVDSLELTQPFPQL